MTRGSLTISILMLLLACGTGEAATGPADPEVVSFVRLVNAHRVSRGLPALVWDGRAAAVARAHSRDMLDHHYFSHSWSDGGSTWTRLNARGVTYSKAGENIAWGQPTGSAVLRSWLHSPGHRKNIEDRSFTHHGVAKVGTYWTHVFFRPRAIR
jgi:uncharacterized protein YkwD